MNKDIKYWIALSTNLKIGAKTFLKLGIKFQSMEEVWKANDQELMQSGIDSTIIKAIREVKAKKNPDEEYRKIQNCNVQAVTYKEKAYPKLLREIPDFPALLYIKGDVDSIDNFCLSVVGSRRYSEYGKRVVENIVHPLAESGMTIVSGLALGIDSLAHYQALRAKGKTVAVLGNGLDRVYPETNRNLAEKIVNTGGVLISEFPIGTPSYKQNFPFRNRIIAGLSIGTLVVEASLNSGSLITARAALDYNREVFAVPGEIFSENSAGPNNLIKMGATLVNCPEDVLNELNIENKIKHTHAKIVIPDSHEEGEILKHLGEIPMHIDKLVELSKLNIVKINQTLVLMEMKGKIRNLGGNQFVIYK